MSVENLLVSFSGGETSAFMAQWLKLNYKQLGYKNIVFVFANTGLENEETLLFVEKCDSYFNLNIHWVEALVWHDERKGTTYSITDYQHAKRKGEPFEEVIKKYGIPNQATPHCTRELKQSPIKSFAKVYFNGEKYHTAIGIRNDEIDRVNSNKDQLGFIYPLVSSKMCPMSKPEINGYWKNMPFRLNLKGYQGNCVTCWKKSDKKLYQIAKENPKQFDFMVEMERKYKTDPLGYDKVFFRNNRSALQILEESKLFNDRVKDDSQEYTYQLDLLGGDSCEIFSECNG